MGQESSRSAESAFAHGPSPWSRTGADVGCALPPPPVEKLDDGAVFVFGMSGGIAGLQRQLRFYDTQTYKAFNRDKFVRQGHTDGAVQLAIQRLMEEFQIKDSYAEKGYVVNDGYHYYMYIGPRYISLGTSPRQTPLPDYLQSDIRILKDLIHRVSYYE